MIKRVKKKIDTRNIRLVSEKLPSGHGFKFVFMLAKVEELWGRRGVICVPLCVYVCVVWWWWWWGELDGWEIEKTQARQYLWG